jgi:hypothetical protein
VLLRLLFFEGLYLVGRKNCSSGVEIITTTLFRHDNSRIIAATFPMGDDLVE